MQTRQMGSRMEFNEVREAIFNAAVESLMEAGQDQATATSNAKAVVDNSVLTRSYLRLEQAVSTTVTQYAFPVLINNGTVRPTEKRLNLQDAFYASSIQVLIGLAATAAATAFPLYTYNSPTVFGAGAATLALENLYAGFLSITVNQSVILSAWDILQHKVIPQFQATGATEVAPFDQADYGQDSVIFSQPNVVLIGSKNNNIVINLPGSIGTLAGGVTLIVIIFRGILAQNVTVVS